ncbi:uncharacterized protein LOC108734661 [Agrilus planipennis]|uniref:Uncharacterized protein LOC108734661 n=1 Tax=Agrilus planipennis TaxID=224129 RepID=A0A1W4WP39_AGRPL|nr:uncharacterized protein LOC108734661 [Agrilus planipennis]
MPQNRMSVCSKCQDPLPEFDFVTCSSCKGKLHYECAGVRESNWRKCSLELKRNWKCYACRQRQDIRYNERNGEIPNNHSGNGNNQTVATKPDTVATKNYNESGVSPVIESLKVIVKQLTKDELSEVKRKISDIESVFTTYSEKQDEFSVLTNKLTKEYSKLKNECDHLQELNRKIEGDVTDVKLKAEEMRCVCSMQSVKPKDHYLLPKLSNPSMSSRRSIQSPPKKSYQIPKRLSLIPIRPRKSTEATSLRTYESNRDLVSYTSGKALTHIYDYEAFGRYIANEISSLTIDKNQRKLRLDIIKLCLDYHDKEDDDNNIFPHKQINTE